ncbi:cell wall metabolism sensor histidine kinase WalK, partial [Photobacterium nomapromontoriensis]
MNRKTKILLVGAAIGGGLAAGGVYLSNNTPYDDVYMNRLDLITLAREIYGIKHTPTWEIVVDVPDNPPQEKWNTQHNMPQLITTIQNPDHGLYTMNMNGTDVRLLFTAKEIGGNIESKGLSRPS